MRGSSTAAIGAAITTAVVACSSFGEPSSLSEDDAGADGGDGGGDAFVESGTCAPKPSGCATGIVHSLDFASTAFPPPAFAPETENAVVERVEAGHTCTPGALRASTTVPDVSGATADGSITRNVKGTFTTGRLAFAFRGPKPVADSFLNIGCAVMVRPPTTPNVRTATRLALIGSRLVLDGTARDENDTLAPGLPEIELDSFVSEAEAESWHTLDATLSLTSTTLRVVATFDGKTLAPYELPVFEPTGRIEIDCGILYSDERATKHTIDIDDVLVELCP